jgi:hypothetical protein
VFLESHVVSCTDNTIGEFKEVLIWVVDKAKLVYGVFAQGVDVEGTIG